MSVNRIGGGMDLFILVPNWYWLCLSVLTNLEVVALSPRDPDVMSSNPCALFSFYRLSNGGAFLMIFLTRNKCLTVHLVAEQDECHLPLIATQVIPTFPL